MFSKGTLDAFVLRSIYPKLSQCLSEFIINPHQQHLGKLCLAELTLFFHSLIVRRFSRALVSQGFMNNIH